MMYRSFYVGIIFLLLSSQDVVAYQKKQDSSKEKSYQFLADQFYANEQDSVVSRTYANKYLSKAKLDHDTIKIADGYYFLSSISKSEVAQKYCDSIIAISKNINSEFYPTFAYLNKATFYYNEGDFKKAFDYFLKVHEEAEKYDNLFLSYSSKKNIGILKAILGENETALVTLRECLRFYSKYKERAPVEYLETLFALSESYNFNKVLDSATYINKLGYMESILFENEKYEYFFTLNEGINQYSKGNYVAAKDSLSKSIVELKSIGEKANLGQAHFYLGKTLSVLGFQEEAIEEHKRVDEIIQEIPQIIPESRESYEVLISHYKKNGDKDNQLKYIERLIRVDSILNSNYKYLIKNVVQNYDTPRLLSEKQEIIDSLKTEKKSSFLTIVVLAILSLISLVFLGFNYKKRVTYKRRFDELYNSNSSEKKTVTKKMNSKESNSLGISEEIVNGILSELEKFEANQGFLKPNIVTNDLAKKMNTNSKYLSRVVNHYRNKNFSMYINELRIDYCIEKLKTDKKFMNYTVKAIAREIGFNSTDAFSKSFYKIKGIQPSYFIRELEKQQNS
ncbi:AraC family transcriptional regulator [Aquimarina gracilis]|uniref:AraC family transcriptional regulator n=1 Tax=Aquimarina gracilis TaxID=874422 RepID=A0ABU6A081_9FLAO|nr:AraC family transcriptional regulator [Aquimarina gracilis]MEB3347543.1 AraC family transcriptional regulator [Aquimarina gracilis]